MDRILLADDSPHAQRMGERILRDEGYEVVSVTDGETALLRLDDVRPSLILADVFLPGRSGIDICRYCKSHPEHGHVRIILTAGMLESFDEDEARAAGADAIIKKPFEATMVLDMVKPLIEAAHAEVASLPAAPEVIPETAAWSAPLPVAEVTAPVASVPEAPAPPAPLAEAFAPEVPIPVAPRDVVEEPVAAVKAVPETRLPASAPVEMPAPVPVAPRMAPESEPVSSGTGVSEEELLRAAVTVALDAAFPALVDDITARVLRNLRATVSGPVAPDTDPPADVPVPVAPLTTE